MTAAPRRRSVDAFPRSLPATGDDVPAAPIPLRYCPPNPGAESCDKVDNDCDGVVDNLVDGGSCP